MHNRTQRLIQLMQEHDVTPKEVGEMLGRTAQTVRVWRSRYDARTIPALTLDALELKLSKVAA
ncbi:helix-turn-helix domain-containing protein [Dyella sp. 2RAF44]|uniref:helix-turn-helix domain-containing protein n=1 Tax=Dyella sp. 2RAF44 TaxID=3233000 RepID=UPI003F916724